MFKTILAIGAMGFAAYSHAEPITITQTYSNVDFYEYGVAGGVTQGQTPTGDWIFKGTVDSHAANIATWSDSGAYELTQLTLTQASLGLFDVVITNASTLFFYSDRFGFANTPAGTTPWTVIVYEADHFSTADTLQEYLALATTPAVVDTFTSFGPQWEGFALEDGRRLYGWGFGAATSSISSVVPEPTSLALVLAGFAALVLRAQRRGDPWHAMDA